MLSLRSVRTARLNLIRQNATVAVPKPIEVKTQGRMKPGRRLSKSPQVSLENPREWKRPIAFGVLPAYDEALLYIMKDSSNLKKEANKLKASIEADEKSSNKDEALLEAKRKKLGILEVQSEINIPEVRWKVANGMADMSKPVHRHIVEQRWRGHGDLDLLMERLHQMHIVPDVIGILHPTVDLRLVVTGPTTSEATLGGRYVKPLTVEPGVFLKPRQTYEALRIHPVVFHPETRLYTLLMVDPDVPDEINQSFQTYLHWLKPNIPLSASMSNARIPDLDTHTRYIPPHPQQGTPYHRYTTLLLQQPSATEEISVPIFSEDQRMGFNLRAFMQKYGLDGTKGSGGHMFRQIWNQDVSKIYTDILKTPEPRFGRPENADPYAGRGKRYIL